MSDEGSQVGGEAEFAGAKIKCTYIRGWEIPIRSGYTDCGRAMMTQALLDVESMVRWMVFARLSERWWTFKRRTASELIKITLWEAP